MEDRVRVGIVGVGNCACALLQGIEFYRNTPADAVVPGLMHTVLGGYHVGDLEISAAFDVDGRKVGKDISEAIFQAPNNTIRFSDVPFKGVAVQRGKTLDGLGKYLSTLIDESDAPVAVVKDVLRETKTDVLVSYLPVGSEEATRWYAEQALEAGCAFINCIPVFIASDPAWGERFRAKGLPVIGDDIKSQVGATIVHRILTHLFNERGVRLERTSQLNVGGNADFFNMLERERLESKKKSKTQAVTSQVNHEMDPRDVYIGPSDHVPWLEDRKWCYIKMEGTTFGDVPLELELKLEVWDSPNSAGVVIDAIRCCKLALNSGIAGPLYEPSSYFMKSPPVQYSDDDARRLTEQFIRRHGKQASSMAEDTRTEGAKATSVPSS